MSSAVTSPMSASGPAGGSTHGPPGIMRGAGWPRVLLWLAAGLYVGLRLLALVLANGLEDHDSARYLINASLILARDLDGIRGLDPDHTPFYPIAIALVGWTGIGVELAARVASFAFSLLTLAAVIGIGRRVCSAAGLAVGVLLLAVSPLLVPLSVSVVSEPGYLAMVYAGMWIFWRQMRQPHTLGAAALGAVFGLAFINRIEGLLFLGAVPVFQAVATLMTRNGSGFPAARLLRWTAAYVLVFCVVAGPQVWWVSDRMGGFAINGRQVWSLMSNQPGVQGRQAIREYMWSLDYSPAEPNLYYVQRHPEVRATLTGGGNVVAMVKLVVRNVQRLYWEHLPALVGPGAVAFFLFGLARLWRRRRALDVVVIGGLIGAALVAPLMHAQLSYRHLAVLVPILLLLAGEGVVFAASLVSSTATPAFRRRVAAGLALCLVAVCAVPVAAAIGAPPRGDVEYAPETLAEPARILRDAQAQEPGRPIVLATRRFYVAQTGGVRRPITLPYTDVDGLMRYLQLNQADFLFLEHRGLVNHAFLREFQAGNVPANLELVHRGETATGEPVELYRILK